MPFTQRRPANATSRRVSSCHASRFASIKTLSPIWSPVSAPPAVSTRRAVAKAKEGVDDKKKNHNAPAVKASAALLWKAPQGGDKVTPARHLTPIRFPETLVIETPFPPDDRSLGWERATTVSKAWDQA